MNDQKVEQLAMRVVGDMGGAFTMALGYIGDRLGLYKEMAGKGPVTSQERSGPNSTSATCGSGSRRWWPPNIWTMTRDPVSTS